MTALSSRNCFLCLLLLLSLLASSPAWATVLVYFWYDQNNLIHFSSQRPHNRDNVHAVEMPSFSDEQAAKLEQNPLSYESLFAAAEAEQAAAAEQLLARQVLEKLKEECATANLLRDKLLNTRRVQMVGEDGQRRDLGYDEKMAEVAKLDKRIAQACKS